MGRTDFSVQVRKVIIRYKRIGYDLSEMQPSACSVINPITLITLLHSLTARKWTGSQTL